MIRRLPWRQRHSCQWSLSVIRRLPWQPWQRSLSVIRRLPGRWRRSWRQRLHWRRRLLWWWKLSMQGCALVSLQWSNYQCNNLRICFGIFAIDVHWLLAMILFKGIKWWVPDFRDTGWHHSKFKYARRWHQNFEDLRWSSSTERQFSPNFRDAKRCHRVFEDARRYHQVFEDERQHYANFRDVRQHNLEGSQWNSKERRCNANFDNARWHDFEGLQSRLQKCKEIPPSSLWRC